MLARIRRMFSPSALWPSDNSGAAQEAHSPVLLAPPAAFTSSGSPFRLLEEVLELDVMLDLVVLLEAAVVLLLITRLPAGERLAGLRSGS